MVVHRQCHSKIYPNSSSARHFQLTIPTASTFLHHTNDKTWNDPLELDLMNVKKSPLMATVDNNNFVKVLPSIRRLYTVFNCLCPNLYQIHCSDSQRVLQELICLIEEHLHINLPATVSANTLLHNEKQFDEFLQKVRFSPLHYLPQNKYIAPQQVDVHCFGPGVHAHDHNNQLNQTILFCFELTTPIGKNNMLPIEVLILDPKENVVANDIKYISTYDQGYKKLFSCTYKPITQQGIYKISLFYNHIEVTKKPFEVFIRNLDSFDQQPLSEIVKGTTIQEIPQYKLEGDGCSTKVVLNSIARFRLRLLSSVNVYNRPTVDSFSVTINDPFGHKIVVQRRTLSPDILELTYQPMSIGEHQLSILYNNKTDRQLTIDVIHDESNHLSSLRPFGPGLQRAIVNIPTEFYVDLNQEKLSNHTINQSHLEFCLEPSFHAEIDYEKHMATVRYTPEKEGVCPIRILESDREILHSPFVAQIQKVNSSAQKPRLTVTGLSKQLIVHRPVEFYVSVENPFNDSNYTVQVEILTDENPPSVSIDRLNSGSYKCSFIPASLGRHVISIDYAGIVSESNPFYCESIQEKDIQLTGPAVNSQCLALNQPTHFYFKLEDFLMKSMNEISTTYESGYSSNEDVSMNSSLTDTTKILNNEPGDYQVTITDGHGNRKPNVLVKSTDDNMKDNIRVDFTPDEQILFINISCTW